jgi:hypothetical protein
MNDNEGKLLSKEELRALAKEQDRRDRLTSRATGRRRKPKGVSERNLLSLSGKKVGETIVFGPEGGLQLIFKPSRGALTGAAARGIVPWTVQIQVAISLYDTQRELTKAGRGLWDREKHEPTIPFKAASQLLACHAEMRKFHEKAKQEGVPKSKMGALREELDTLNEQLIMAHDAISLVIEVLSKGLGKKMQIAFNLLRDDSQWPQDIERLRWHATVLACDLQRPPSKKELKQRHDLHRRIDPSAFAELLKSAALSWLPRARPA